MSQQPLVAIIMGSDSDKSVMDEAAAILDTFQIPYTYTIVSAHRTPERMYDFARTAHEEGYKVVIAGAGGAAHLPGMVAAKTALPVIGVPIQSRTLNGIDSLLSIAQMPAGIPVLTMSIGDAGAKNSALAAASILALSDKDIAANLNLFRKQQTEQVLNNPNPAAGL